MNDMAHHVQQAKAMLMSQNPEAHHTALWMTTNAHKALCEDMGIPYTPALSMDEYDRAVAMGEIQPGDTVIVECNVSMRTDIS